MKNKLIIFTFQNKKKSLQAFFFLIGILFFKCSLLASICVNVSDYNKLYRFATNANELAKGYEFVFRLNHFKDYRFFSAKSDAELATKVNKLDPSICPVILGINPSRECLILGPILKKKKIVGIANACCHDKINDFYPFLFSIAPDVNKYTDEVIKLLNEMPKGEKVFLVYQPTKVYDIEAYKKFKEKYHGPTKDIEVDDELHINFDGFDLKPAESAIFVFFPFPLASITALMELSNKKLITKNTRIIAGVSWIMNPIGFKSVKNILMNAKEVIGVDFLHLRNLRNSEFDQKFSKEFRREPVPMEILAYESTTLAINCYKKAMLNKKFNLLKFHKCILQRHHDLVDNYYFTPHSAFIRRLRPSRVINILDII